MRRETLELRAKAYDDPLDPDPLAHAVPAESPASVCDRSLLHGCCAPARRNAGEGQAGDAPADKGELALGARKGTGPLAYLAQTRDPGIPCYFLLPASNAEKLTREPRCEQFRKHYVPPAKHADAVLLEGS